MTKLQILIALILIASVSAFKPTTNFRYLGDTKPLGYFDPLQITKNSPSDQTKFVREAELQHCRMAMLGFVSIAASEILTNKIGINTLSSQDMISQFPFWFSVGIFELARMKAGWQNPFTKEGNAFKLVKDYQPGNVLGIDDESYSDDLLNKELNNGRLAMIGSLGIMAQELVTQQSVF